MLKYFSRFPDKDLACQFRFFAKTEGITCIILYLVAMPLKYSFHWDLVMIPAGIIHGFFFTLYLLWCIPARKIFNWDDEDFVFALGSAFFPFATFWVENSLTKNKGI